MPSNGKMNVSNAALTRAGLAIQTINRPRRGKSPANMANRQPILCTPCLLSHRPSCGSGVWPSFVSVYYPPEVPLRSNALIGLLEIGLCVDLRLVGHGQHAH